MIDYINIVCRGHVKKIKTIYKKKDKIKILEILFTSNDICIYKQFWNRPGPWSVSVTNNSGYYKLEPLENSLIWKSSALELKAFIYLKNNQKQEALNIFESIISRPSKPSSLGLRAKNMIDFLGKN